MTAPPAPDRVRTGFVCRENTAHLVMVLQQIRERWKRESVFVVAAPGRVGNGHG